MGDEQNKDQPQNPNPSDQTGTPLKPQSWELLGFKSEQEMMDAFNESKFRIESLESQMASQPKERIVAVQPDDILKVLDRSKLEDDPDGAINEAVRKALASVKPTPDPASHASPQPKGAAAGDREVLDRAIREARAEAEKEGLNSGAMFGIMLDIAERKPFLAKTEGGVKEIAKQAMRELRRLVEKEAPPPPEHGDTGGSSSATMGRRGEGVQPAKGTSFEESAREAITKAGAEGRTQDVTKAVFAQHTKLLESYNKR